MIHRYEQNGFFIVLDVHSGAVHVLDEMTYEMTGLLKAPMPKECPKALLDALAPKYGADKLREAYGELYTLYKEGTLFSEDDYEQFSGKMVSSPVKAMCLHIAHDCNLRCEYCFAAKGDFGHGRKLMPLEVGKAAIDFLLENSGSRRNLELDFSAASR